MDVAGIQRRLQEINDILEESRLGQIFLTEDEELILREELEALRSALPYIDDLIEWLAACA